MENTKNNIKKKISYDDFLGMCELAETNNAMQDILEQAKIVYELAKPVEDPVENKSWVQLLKELKKMSDDVKKYKK